MIVKSFLSIFIFALLFFVLILQLVDLFANLWRYLNNDVTILQILQVAYLYIPKCAAFSIPPALLFSISFTLGNYYSNNELISIFGSGISLFRFVFPLWIIGFIFSAGGFFFDEYVVIDSFKHKNEMTKNYLLHILQVGTAEERQEALSFIKTEFILSKKTITIQK